MNLGNQPPYCNTGAQNTLPTGLRSLVDWVSFSFVFVHDLQKIFDILCIPATEFCDMPNGLHGYRKQKACGHIRILYEGTAEMGIHVEMSGQGCREFESYFNLGWDVFFDRVISNRGKFTRLDVAIDDFEGYFSVKQLIRKAKEGCCKSKFKKARYMETISLDDGSTGGTTIYFGQPSSMIKIRVYEKNHERLSHGDDLEEGLEIWNRTEIESKKERADLLAAAIAYSDVALGTIIRGVLSNYLNFLDKGDDENKSRWKVSKFWQRFLNDVEPLILTKKAPDRSIQRIQHWVDRQIEPSLALLFLAKESNLDFLVEALNNGMERLTERDLQMLELYKTQQKDITEMKKQKIKRIHLQEEMDRKEY
jgi:phage replication initiation protein